MTASAIQRIRERFWRGSVCRAGTVLTPAQSGSLPEAMARHILFHQMSTRRVIRRTTALGMVSIPGAMTPSEIQTAYRCGADFVKSVPGWKSQPAYLKAVRAPLPQIRLPGSQGGSMKKYRGLSSGRCLWCGDWFEYHSKNLIAQKELCYDFHIGGEICTGGDEMLLTLDTGTTNTGCGSWREIPRGTEARGSACVTQR